MADFNQDGNLDFAVANAGDNSITILLGNGDGTFTCAHSVGLLGMGSASIAVSDLNGDGRLDYVANPNKPYMMQSFQNIPGSITILLQ